MSEELAGTEEAEQALEKKAGRRYQAEGDLSLPNRWSVASA
jgi:hypothetical protein